MAEKVKDTYSYKGWLVSDKLIKRILAVVGHNMLGGLLLYGIALGAFLVIAIIVGIISLIVSLVS